MTNDRQKKYRNSTPYPGSSGSQTETNNWVFDQANTMHANDPWLSCESSDSSDEPCPDEVEPNSGDLMKPELWTRPLSNGKFNWTEKEGGVWEVLPTARPENLLSPPGSGEPRNQNTLGSQSKYSDFRLTVEFRCPYMRNEWKTTNDSLTGPRNWGNSGIKILGREVTGDNGKKSLKGYEVQILDSFGVTPTGPHGGIPNNERCAALYRIRRPSKHFVNRAMNTDAENQFIPNGEWNRIQIDFMSARYRYNETSQSWERVKSSTITVRFPDRVEVNGQDGLEHSRVGLAPQQVNEKFDETLALVKDDKYQPPQGESWCKACGPIYLQEHDSKVQFRNIRIETVWKPEANGQFDENWQR